MKANPGGYIALSDIIGRDALARRLWRILERQSLVLTAERRLGKTCIIKKMVEEAPEDKLPIYRDLEGIRTAPEFVETLFQDVQAYLGGLERTAQRVRLFLAQLSGTEVGGVFKLPDIAAPHWKTLLTKIIEDLLEHQDRMVVLFWDEMPYMIYNIKHRDGEGAGMELLDALRSLRQMYSRLRMVFTGSIGLHNVVTSLKREGYANDPTNDMDTVEVPPLTPGDAQELARRLLDGENIQTHNHEGTAQTIAEAVDGIPYLIHHLVDQLVQRGGMVDAVAVDHMVDTCLTDPHDRWHLRHYRERIDIYYSPDERPFALNILDVLSTSSQSVPFDDVFNSLKSRLVTEDSEMVRYVLMLLQRDHYIVQQTSGAFSFRFPLIQKSWKLQRSLP